MPSSSSGTCSAWTPVCAGRSATPATPRSAAAPATPRTAGTWCRVPGTSSTLTRSPATSPRCATIGGTWDITHVPPIVAHLGEVDGDRVSVLLVRRTPHHVPAVRGVAGAAADRGVAGVADRPAQTGVHALHVPDEEEGMRELQGQVRPV